MFSISLVMKNIGQSGWM